MKPQQAAHLVGHVAGERRSPIEASSFTFHNAGRFDGDEHDLFMFTCWNADHQPCGVHSVREPEVQAAIAALESKGYVNRTARHEQWDFGVKAWVCTGGVRRVAPTAGARRGLPIPSTAPLTTAERELLRTAERATRLVADGLAEAIETNRVDFALHAVRLSGDAGVRVQQLAEILGKGR